MSHTLAPADVSHYYQRLAELSTLPFWQREEFTEPAGPECGHVWHWQDVYPELARSGQFAADAAALQRRALILRNPGLTAPAGGATPTIAASHQMLFPGERAPIHAHSISAARFGLAGSGARNGQHSPVRRYPWDQAYPALQRLMARSPGRNTLTSLAYRNPLTGGHARATLGCLLQGLPTAARTRPRRETASSVIVVARGTGTLICGGQSFPLLPNDVAAIPAWTWHQLTASDHDLVLFRLTDRPIHDAFGLFQAEEEV